MALWGSLETIEQQLVATPRFAVALNYLREAFDPDSAVHARISGLPVGETQQVELGDGVFAMEQVYESKPREAGRFEAHRDHIDLQAIVAGDEIIEVTTAAELAVTEDAIATRDVRFFADGGPVSSWRMRAGEIAVFFPVDVHKPSLAIDGRPTVVRKTVVKVRL
ncbi:YhcH/YjgK/YiaL family protein [Synoicihabitans lomoniglobus]|uniref:YhcH/YjgK/YiaL family protein n=1 Tax=Synoicihabitans lomoniglobus TaxID=2909285 RepID=A0AAE9ZV29_9BACT|nr:YhcH/YjgK/YiaL family protein [Opitutaceae bacterium LMO-M01]WED63008.1 YhcH/YjgK/YiaL family protein [Opitutaceae bacterium LMO-M01]